MFTAKYFLIVLSAVCLSAILSFAAETSKSTLDDTKSSKSIIDIIKKPDANLKNTKSVNKTSEATKKADIASEGAVSKQKEAVSKEVEAAAKEAKAEEELHTRKNVREIIKKKDSTSKGDASDGVEAAAKEAKAEEELHTRKNVREIIKKKDTASKTTVPKEVKTMPKEAEVRDGKVSKGAGAEPAKIANATAAEEKK